MTDAVNPVDLLKELIRFPTVNPPGDERECLVAMQNLLQRHGISASLIGEDSNRPNLIARVSGRGEAPPLLLYGHVDVVPVEGQSWSVPPFDAVEKDGWIWGRGALDMKSGVAMLMTAFIEAAKNQTPGDVILLLLSDEEAGGHTGASFLVKHHPELFLGVRHAIGEFGGFTLHIGTQRFYPIQVAEKQYCAVRVSMFGEPGHAAAPPGRNALYLVGTFLARLKRHPLPVAPPAITKIMLKTIANHVGGIRGLLIQGLLQPWLAPLLLRLMGNKLRIFGPLVRSNISPTIIHGGHKRNVIPELVDLELDARLLPGYTADKLLTHLRRLAPHDAKIEVTASDVARNNCDLSQMPILSDIIRAMDPQGIPVPMLLPGVTDARHFDKLGIQTYGFLPMSLPSDYNFLAHIHAADERIPAAAVVSGAAAIAAFLFRYRG